ncbi:MAG TPA: class I SAM-dependent methyltransferase [Oscillospiraceae bacterium]|nr:class I SAM-dependent methyltransferase [Oscillospiraceae bacterium]
MLDRAGFDAWTSDYEGSVARCAAAGDYPFAGYHAVLDGIFDAVSRKEGASVLDLGFGTGALAGRLYEAGHPISGVDFSEKMAASARKRMPDAELIVYDFARGLPPAFSARRFDFILSTYAVHHLDPGQQTALLRALSAHLLPGGAVLLGDVAFGTRAEEAACRREAAEAWDPDEHYLIFEELQCLFPYATFRKISRCAGIVTIPAI